VKWFVDTSVLVPVFIPGHIHHQRSFDLFSRAEIIQASCAAHSLAEVYATVTRIPGRHRASGEQALRFLEAIEERFPVAPIVVIGPVPANVLDPLQWHALAPVVDQFGLRPAGPAQSRLQVVQNIVANGDTKGLCLGAHSTPLLDKYMLE